MPCETDHSGVYRRCETGAVLVEVDRCVTSAAIDFKQLTAWRKEHLEGIWVCFLLKPTFFGCLQIIVYCLFTQTVVYVRAQDWGTSAQLMFALCVFSTGGGPRVADWENTFDGIVFISQCFLAILTYVIAVMFHMNSLVMKLEMNLIFVFLINYLVFEMSVNINKSIQNNTQQQCFW